MKINSTVDAILDMLDEEEDPTEALIKYVEDRDAWDWTGDETQPNARMAVLESSGAFWAVGIQDLPGRRGRRVSRRCATRQEAAGMTDAWCGA